MYKEVSLFFGPDVLLVAVPPPARLVEEVLFETFAGADVIDGALIEEREGSIWLERGEGYDKGEHFYCPGVDSEEEHARVEAIDVPGGDDVFVGKVGWREEKRVWDLGVEDYGVGIEPAGTACRLLAARTFSFETGSVLDGRETHTTHSLRSF